MKYLLKPDKVMDGLITKLIENIWKESKTGKGKWITAEEFKNIHNAILVYDEKNKEIFQEIPREISTPIDVRACKKKDCVEFFDNLGFVFEDGMYASGCGRFNYIYRAKGNRKIWMKNGEIIECSMNCTVDANGFYLNYEEIDDINLNDEYINRFFKEEDCFLLGKLKDPYFTIKHLLSINKKYNKAYYIEYLIDPPDVQTLTEFSLNLRSEVWESILDLGKNVVQGRVKSEEIELFKFCVGFMKEIQIDIEIGQAIGFFEYIINNPNYIDMNLAKDIVSELKSSYKKETDSINRKIDELRLSDKSDIFEIKPSVAGIEMNLNEVIRRIGDYIKKRKNN